LTWTVNGKVLKWFTGIIPPVLNTQLFFIFNLIIFGIKCSLP
jgi:hypothetical protein